MYLLGFPNKFTCIGFPIAEGMGGAVVKNLPAMQETQEMRVRFLGWEDLLE